MTLLTNREISNVKFPLYYIFVDTSYGFKKICILTEVEAKVKLEKEEEKGKVQILNTVWKQLNWKEQNEIYSKCTKVNASTGQSEIDYTKYRDLKIKCCLIDWDYLENNQKIKVTAEIIDQLNPDVVIALFNKYEDITTIEVKDRGN